MSTMTSFLSKNTAAIIFAVVLHIAVAAALYAGYRITPTHFAPDHTAAPTQSEVTKASNNEVLAPKTSAFTDQATTLSQDQKSNAQSEPYDNKKPTIVTQKPSESSPPQAVENPKILDESPDISSTPHATTDAIKPASTADTSAHASKDKHIDSNDKPVTSADISKDDIASASASDNSDYHVKTDADYERLDQELEANEAKLSALIHQIRSRNQQQIEAQHGSKAKPYSSAAPSDDTNLTPDYPITPITPEQ